MAAIQRQRFTAPDDDTPQPTKRKRGNPNWVKGQPKKGGRKKGTPNATTRFLKDAIQEAMDLAGSDGRGTQGAAGYLAWVARKHPAVFGKILEKLLPFTINNHGSAPLAVQYVDRQEIVLRMKERGLPVPSLLEPPKYRPPVMEDVIDVETDDDTDRVEADD